MAAPCRHGAVALSNKRSVMSLILVWFLAVSIGSGLTLGGHSGFSEDDRPQLASPIGPPSHQWGAGLGSQEGMPYRLHELATLTDLLYAHSKYQTMTLMDGNRSAPVVVCRTSEGSGLGNRIPGVITSFVVALFTGRVWLLESSLLEYMDFPLPVEWSKYNHIYANTTSCDADHFTRLASPTLQFCGAPGQRNFAPMLVFKDRWDYDLPMLQINPALQPFFQKFFPKGDVFYRISSYLMTPKPYVRSLLEPYAHLAANCNVGMHLRTKKPGTSARLERFLAIAKAVAVGGEGSFFLASDARVVFEIARRHRATDNVWWSKLTEEGMNATTKAGNPATEISAIVDFLLLSKCKHVVLTAASSFGWVAAGYAGITPVYVIHGPHNDPFFNPWYAKAITSEPCFCKAAIVHRVNSTLAWQFRHEHPLWMHHNQCSYDPKVINWAGPQWECALGQSCREV